jgi:uncharacterized Tic20 family protein
MAGMSSTPPPPPPPYAPPPPLSPDEERLWATLVHVGALLLGFLAPLIAYLVLRDRGPFIRWHTAQALNFHLTVLIGYLISGVLILLLIGFVLFFAIYVLTIVFAILAAVAANRGEYYRYPMTIPFVS